MKTKKAKTTVVGSLLASAGLTVMFLPAYAGNLEPSAPPGLDVGWGSNSYGQATPPEGPNFIAIAAGLDYSLVSYVS